MKILTRKVSDVMVCDYCQHRKCNWTKVGPDKIPSRCFKVTSIEIADDFVEEEEFDKRVKIAKRIASYDPNEKLWYLNPTVEDPLTGYELVEVVEEEVNEWSDYNDLELSDMVDYEEEGFERFESQG